MVLHDLAPGQWVPASSLNIHPLHPTWLLLRRGLGSFHGLLCQCEDRVRGVMEESLQPVYPKAAPALPGLLTPALW